MLRVTRNTAVSLRHTFYVDETPTSADGVVTVSITRADGSTLTAGNAILGAPGVYTFVLPPQAMLNLLAVTWSGTWSGNAHSEVDQVEVAGGFYLTLAAIRSLDRLSDPAKFPISALADARQWFEDRFESYVGVAWSRRFRRAILDGSGNCRLLLPDYHPRAILSCSLDGVAFTSAEIADLSLDDSGEITRKTLGRFGVGAGNVVIEYEHGHDQPTADIVDAAKIAIRSKLLADRSGREPYLVASEGLVQRFSRPGLGRPFGDDDVDAVANARRMVKVGVA